MTSNLNAQNTENSSPKRSQRDFCRYIEDRIEREANISSVVTIEHPMKGAPGIIQIDLYVRHDWVNGHKAIEEADVRLVRDLEFVRELGTPLPINSNPTGWAPERMTLIIMQPDWETGL